jgi:hypothetical protein
MSPHAHPEGNQRWRGRRHFFVPPERRFRPARYDVLELPGDAAAKAFVLQHHYAGSYPAARRRYGLFGPAGLEGVAVFSVPCNDRVLTGVFAAPAHQTVELGRFVLLDQVGFNGESYMLARCFELLRREGFRGVVSFCDPVPRTTADGQVVFRGHLGTIYQAANAVYLGRGTARTLRLLPDGRVLSERALSKLRVPDRLPRVKGWRYAADLLEEAGADPAPEPGCGDLAGWAARWVPLLTRPLRHPGCHRYAFALDRRLRPRLPPALAYPKHSPC